MNMSMLVVLFLLSLPAVQCGWNVTYSTTRVCGLKGASVELPCTYEYSRFDLYLGGEWYEERSGRVRDHNPPNYDCSLKIDKLSDDHSGVYHFRFYTTRHHNWITGRSGVVLSITDLEVKEDAVVGNQNQIKVTCSTSCSLGSQHVWYKNGRTLPDKTTASMVLDSTRPSEKGSYYCAVKGYEAHRSSAVCVPREQCWSVTYSSRRVCGLKGASVVLPCTYDYPWKDTYLGGEWYEEQRGTVRKQSNSKYPDCSLNIDNLSENHAGVYKFQFNTALQSMWITDESGVELSVTGLRVKEGAVAGNRNKTKVTCSTSCTLGPHLQYAWYKDGQPLQEKNTASMVLDSTRPSEQGRYSCAVKGYEAHRSSAVYLQVKEEAVVGNQNLIEVTCSTSCSLDFYPQYVWYKNRQTLPDETTSSILLDSTRPSEEGSYSCAVKGHEGHRSPTVCAPAEQCWGVTYSPNSICVLKGSSVDISCTYKYPRDQNITTTFWFNNTKNNHQPEDLRLGKDYQNHTEYLGIEKNSCTLRLKDIKVSHSGEYAFRCLTEQGEDYSGLPGVNITVTALQVFIPPEAVTEGKRVTLTCDTTCRLSKDPIFMWYRNGQPVTYKHTTRDNKLHLNPVSSEDAGNYSCAVKGHESLSSTAVFLNVRYSPRITISLWISPGETEDGSSVTLTCSSDANPPVHNYTWYMKNGTASLVRGTGESISFNVTSDTSGLYYCEAQNELGSRTSSEVAVPPKDPEAVAMMLLASITIFILSLLLILGIVYLRRTGHFHGCVVRNHHSRDCGSPAGVSQGVHSDVHDDTYTALNPRTTSSEYDTLQGVHSDVHDDTYTAPNPRTTSSEYDTLQNVRSGSDTYMPLQRTAHTSVYETLQRRETPPTEMELKDLKLRMMTV
ncbi:sialoadhesin-like isoform X2 [Alosa pseudoharengus]|uniref:sialoadhesin-like isoform X2 n=1 Tax=Alosa pseudoharengus TaxID=34774 RepID=UPI003F89707A